MINIYHYIELLLLAVLLLFGLYYLFGLLKEKNAGPPLWQQAKKEGNVSEELISALSAYADKNRFFTFWLQVRRLKQDNVPGDFAELGVYKGETAKILHLMDKTRIFHLFDTFRGFDNEDLSVETGEAATYTKHNFADTSLQSVKRRLNDKTFVFHEGRFPETAKEVTDTTFALVNMDADLYLPTKAGLEFFYPRLSPGGVIFIHDYRPQWPGIVKAVDEFVRRTNATLVFFSDKDGTVMIVKEKQL